jgi:chitinase
MFPRRKPFYTYQGLVEAAATFPTFATQGDSGARKREAAAFLANVAHETEYLVYIEEIVKDDYCGGGDCACAPGKQYYGRGPLQISWNYNYGAAGAALGQPLCSDPDLVARDAKVAWQTALWFWTVSTGAGSTTCHDEIGAGSFGGTIRVINGGKECGGANPSAVTRRTDAYKAFCNLLGVDPGSNLGC